MNKESFGGSAKFLAVRRCSWEHIKYWGLRFLSANCQTQLQRTFEVWLSSCCLIELVRLIADTFITILNSCSSPHFINRPQTKARQTCKTLFETESKEHSYAMKECPQNRKDSVKLYAILLDLLHFLSIQCRMISEPANFFSHPPKCHVQKLWRGL